MMTHACDVSTEVDTYPRTVKPADKPIQNISKNGVIGATQR